MTLARQAKTRKSQRKGPPQAGVRGGGGSVEPEAPAAAPRQGIPPVEMSKDAKPGPRGPAAKGQPEAERHRDQPSAHASDAQRAKLDRKPSLRRKFGALLSGSADLPAAINRGLQPIRRSMSFGKDLDRQRPSHGADASAERPQQQQQRQRHQHFLGGLGCGGGGGGGGLTPFRTRSVQRYNSLSSLAENEERPDEGRAGQSPSLAASEERIYRGEERAPGSRPRSMIESAPEDVPKRRGHVNHVAPYGRFSDHYDFTIDLSKPPCEASSLPVLTPDTIDREDAESGRRWMEQQVKNGWSNLRASARNLSLLRGLGFYSGKRSGNQSGDLKFHVRLKMDNLE